MMSKKNDALMVILGLIFIINISHGADANISKNARNCYILTIGDSNGAGPGKWPEKLAAGLGEGYRIINNSQSGRTIGFDNLGKKSLNTVKQINDILKDACAAVDNGAGFDKILICLGTNDCKACFDDRQSEVTKNLEKLITSIHEYNYPGGKKPELIIISPPPYGKKASSTSKYKDGDKKVKALVPQFEELSKKLHCGFINLYAPMLPDVEELSIDGVHFTDEGYSVMADLIGSALEKEELNEPK
ncbi:MAG: GDSL-type esterase/lipase family protein [Calditrichia bacterium]